MLPEIRLPIAPPHPAYRFALTPWFYGWTIVAVGLMTVTLAQGTRGSFGVLLLGIEQEAGWGRGLISGAIALNAVAMALVALPLGIALDRWGPRWTFGGLALVVGLGLALLAAAQTPWQLYLTLGLALGVGLGPLRVMGPGVVAAQWFVRRRGLARGIMATGMGLGLVCLTPLVQAVIDAAGWRAACWLLAGLALLVILPVNALLMRARPEDLGLFPDGEGTLPARRGASLVAPPLPLRDALRYPRLRFLLLGSSCCGVGLHLLLVHGVPHLVDLGMSPARAAWAMALVGAMAIGGNPLLGYLYDRWSREGAFTLGLSSMIAATLLLWSGEFHHEILLVVFAALFGLGYAGAQGMITLFLADMVPGRSLGTLTGLQSMAISVGVALGPAVGGWVHDASGTYAAAFAFSIVADVVAIAGIWLAAPRRGALLPTRG